MLPATSRVLSLVRRVVHSLIGSSVLDQHGYGHALLIGPLQWGIAAWAARTGTMCKRGAFDWTYLSAARLVPVGAAHVFAMGIGTVRAAPLVVQRQTKAVGTMQPILRESPLQLRQV